MFALKYVAIRWDKITACDHDVRDPPLSLVSYKSIISEALLFEHRSDAKETGLLHFVSPDYYLRAHDLPKKVGVIL